MGFRSSCLGLREVLDDPALAAFGGFFVSL